MDITDQSFEEEVLQSAMPVMVDFWATWCGPCRMMEPLVEEISTKYVNRLKVVRLDVDANPNTAGRFAIHSIPSLLFFKHGRLVNQIIGAGNKARIMEMAEEVLTN